MSSPATAVAPDLAPALGIADAMAPVTACDIIPLLQRLQEAYGYLPRAVVLAVCERTGLPASRVFGVATFYAQFYLERRGRHTVRCCRGTACHVRGAPALLDAIVKTLGIGDGQTDKDYRVSFETVACLGACALSPVMVVDKQYYGNMTPRRAEKILRKLMEVNA